MDNVIFIGRFEINFANKEIKLFYIVSHLQKLRTFGSDADKVFIFASGKYFSDKEKAFEFARKTTEHIHYVMYVNQSYPLMTYAEALTKIKSSIYYN
jgi:hypothetical protein